MGTGTTLQIKFSQDSLQRLRAIAFKVDLSPEELIKEALRLYEAAVEADDAAIKRGGKVHLAAKLRDGQVELGEQLFALCEAV